MKNNSGANLKQKSSTVLTYGKIDSKKFFLTQQKNKQAKLSTQTEKTNHNVNKKPIKNKRSNLFIKQTSLVFASLIVAGLFFAFSYAFWLQKPSKFVSANEYDFNFPQYDTEEILGTVEHTTPETFGDHEQDYYPSYYNRIIDLTDDKKQALWDECNKVLNDTPAAIAENRLQKHISADGQFYGIVPDDAPRIIKKVSVNHTVPRRHSLSVFAPAGEVLTVTIDESMINKGLKIYVGYPYVENNINGPEKFGLMTNVRMPKMHVEFALTSTETKIGSPFGGMVTLEGPSGNVDFDITISGGVDNPDYKLGVSTHEDWVNIKKAPGLFVWMLTPYVYHVIPKAYVQNIDDPYDALLFWHKSAMLSNYTIGRENDTTPSINVYDDYVPSGGAVAFVPAFFCICPSSWGSSAMNIDDIMYKGNWGNLHEFNHQNQNRVYASSPWGIGENGEVTNNVLNAMSYISYSQIATTRTETLAPTHNANSWEVTTDPYYNYNKLLSENAKVDTFEKLGTNKLFAYIDLVHNFGIEKFADFVRAMYGLGDTYGFESLMTSNALKDGDNFAIFACNYFKKDFSSYFNNVWKLNLKNETISAIKALGFEEYFTINSVYASGVKGIETGRPFTIYVGAETIFDFNEKTLTSADDFSIKSVGKPKNGNIVKLSDGKYSYTMNEGCREDSFDVVFEVTLNGKKHTKTLVVKLAVNANYVERTTYSMDTNTLSVQDAIKTASAETKLSTSQVSNFTNVADNGLNLTYYRAKAVFPETKKVTFVVYGDDKTYLKIGEQEAYTTTHIPNLQTALKTKDNKIEVEVEKDLPLLIEAYCYNTGGPGGLTLKISDDGENFSDIPNSYLYYYGIEQNEVEFYSTNIEQELPLRFDLTKNYYNNFYTKPIIAVKNIESITVLTPDGQTVNSNGDTFPQNMFDGDYGTFFHTAWRGNITAMPHEYTIKFSRPVSFNAFTMRFRNNSIADAVGDFELYVSDDGNAYDKIYEGSNTSGICNLSFENFISGQYVKLVVKSNAKGNVYTVISELEFSQTKVYEDFNLIASNNKDFTFFGEWSNRDGHFLNGYGAKTKSGKVQFVLDGTSFILYSINKESKIYIDDKEYVLNENDSPYAPSFIVDDLKEGKHTVTIVGNDFTLNHIKTDGEISKYHDSTFTYIILLSVGIFVILSVLTVCICQAIEKRKQNKS